MFSGEEIMVTRIAIIGFGTVGQGFAEILVEQQEYLRDKFGFEWKIVAIADKLKGSLYDPEGLDMQEVLSLVKETGSIDGYHRAKKGIDSIYVASYTNSDIVVEVTWTDIKTGEPAISHTKAALSSGKHVVMANKGPVALASRELLELAQKNRVQLKYEGTVLSGTPAVTLGLNSLAASDITKVQGILNGTTNYILTEMEKGLSYSDALIQAQDLGYAEADPTADVEGHDALAKIVIIANTIMGASLKVEDISCQGISKITETDIRNAKKRDMRWKLIATAERLSDGTVQAHVKPIEISLEHPLASVMGPTNAITYSTKYLEDVTIIGPGAGRLPTGYSILEDVLEIYRSIKT